MGPKKKKPRKKKQRQFFDDEDLESEREARLKAEQKRLEKIRIQREIEEELHLAKQAKKARDRVAIEEEMFRNQVLQKHCSDFRTLDNENIMFRIENRKEKEWENYINCNHRPLGNNPPALNTFLYRWKLLEESLSINNILEEVETILSTTKPIVEYLADPLDMNKSTILNLTEAKFNYYKEIRNLIDKVTFDAIMDIDKYYERVGFLEVEIFKNSNNFQLWLWGWCVGGRAIKPLEEKRPSRKAGTLHVTLPGIMEEKRYHMRVFYTSYDPFSILSKSYHCPISCDNLSLYEEIVKIRKMEVKALKDFYKGDYDEDVMPWWFLIDPEILEERRAKEQEAKKMEKKKKRQYGINDEKLSIVGTVDKVEAPGKLLDQKIETEETQQLTDQNGTEENEEDESLSLKSKKTCILYSRSMTDLMQARKNEFNGPRYYPEDEPIAYLDEHGELLSFEDSTIRVGGLLRTEKHTPFRACLVMDYLEPEPPYLFREINKTLFDTDEPDPICFADNRVFLDWKSLEDECHDIELFREHLENIMFGDSEAVFKDGKITYQKRKPKLRSIKELFQDLLPQKSITNLNLDSELRSKEEVFKVSKPPTKVSNAIEMRELESEISRILGYVWSDYSNDYISKLILLLDPSSLNLRQHVIVGGVYYIEFFEEEPQPFINKCDFKMQLHYGEYKLKQVIFHQIPQIRIDLNIEMEKKVSMVKRQISERRKSRWSMVDVPEPEFPDTDDDLIWIEIMMQKNIFIIDTPIPVRWDEQNKYWTTKNTYGAKWKQINEIFHFKLGKSGAFALSINRFSHLPYDDFHIKPSSNWKQDHSVTVQIKARYFPILFLVKEDSVSIVEIEHEEVFDLTHIIGVPFKVYELIDVMRKSGLDLFPDWDSFLYVNSSLRKVRALEEHMYYSLGYSSPAFEYTASKANAQAGEDRIIVQVRECAECSGSQAEYRTMIIEPYRIISTTVQPMGKIEEDNDNGGFGYHPDLLSFLEAVASKKAKQRMRRASKNTMVTVISLIMAMKILSYS